MGRERQEVFEDLLDEAEGLPMGPADEGEPSTTLLVCPYAARLGSTL